MNVILCLLFLCILLPAGSAFAQYTPPKPVLFVKVERVFQEKEPAWKLEDIKPGTSSDPLSESIVYRSRKGQAAISVSIWRREQDAQESFAGVAIADTNMRGKSSVRRTLPNLGDENYMWRMPRSTAWPTIKFRKGNIEVSVFAPNIAIATTFARHVLDQIQH